MRRRPRTLPSARRHCRGRHCRGRRRHVAVHGLQPCRRDGHDWRRGCCCCCCLGRGAVALRREARRCVACPLPTALLRRRRRRSPPAPAWHWTRWRTRTQAGGRPRTADDGGDAPYQRASEREEEREREREQGREREREREKRLYRASKGQGQWGKDLCVGGTEGRPSRDVAAEPRGALPPLPRWSPRPPLLSPLPLPVLSNSALSSLAAPWACLPALWPAY